MFRYLPLNTTVALLLAGLMVSALVVQLFLPVVVFAADEETTPATTQIKDPTPPEETTTSTDTETETVVSEAALVTEEPDEANEPEEEVSTEPTETAIDTGDAVAGSEVETDINTTEVETNAEPVDDVEAELPEETATVSANELLTSPEENLPRPSTITATNTATTTTNATTTADTGSNTASGHTVTIDTGDAIAYTDVLNVVNTNIVDSDGLIDFINGTLGYQSFDLRDEFALIYDDFETSQSTSPCSLDSCADPNITVNTTNTATINNNVTVTANTGDNTAVGDSASITTGDAYASANIINVANTNITDSNYLLLVFNNFDDYAGDIILPNSSFFNTFLTQSSGISNATIDTNNNAQITNNITTSANTGDNEAVGDSASITTGDAGAQNEVTNLVNQNIIGGSTFSMLIRVHGSWSGGIAGLPPGLSWRETPQGIEIFSESNNSSGPVARNLTLSTDNQATINNNVQVFALTGDNKAGGEEAAITTGNAYADSSILNIANTNVIGSNWSNLIFTIYGNWSGNLTFGQPDLWLGVSASSPSDPIMPGAGVTYTYTVFNHGDTVAPNVVLESRSRGDVLSFSTNDGKESDRGMTTHRWNLGDIAAGETREFSYTAGVNGRISRDTVSAIPLTSRVMSSVRDADESDNEDVVTVYVGEEHHDSSGGSPTFPAHLEIEKVASRDMAQPGDSVEYTVTFFNRGGQLYDALLVDTLENEAGDIIQQQTWPFDEIKNWEKVTVSYTLEFDSSMATGTYTNYAQLVGFHESRKTKYQRPYESPVASHVLHLGTQPVGQVLGATDSVCSPYLTTYLRFDTDNDPEEVRKLQHFLNQELHRQLAISGYFDLATEQAVRDFQLLHRDEVLLPWGLERDSGFVYYTTQKKINEIMCEGRNFPLNAAQQAEMEQYKTRVQSGLQFGFAPTHPTKTPTTPVAVTPAPTTVPTPRETTLAEPPDPPAPPVPPVPPVPPNPWGGLTSWWRSLTSNALLSVR